MHFFCDHGRRTLFHGRATHQCASLVRRTFLAWAMLSLGLPNSRPAPADEPPGRPAIQQRQLRQRLPAGRQLQVGPLRIQRQAGDGDGEGAVEGAMFAHDRASWQRLLKAQQLLEERRYAEAVRNLGGLIQSPEDFFFQPDKNAPVYRSLKTEAQRMIGQMPREGRETFELSFGAEARRQLEEAIAAGDMAAVAEVSRRFFHTQAGYTATHLLGLDHLDHGRAMAAAMCLERLHDTPAASAALEPNLSVALALCWLRSGMNERAGKVMQAAREAHAGKRFELGGQSVALPAADEDAVAWLERQVGNGPIAASAVQRQGWLMQRGDPARLGQSKGGMPLLSPRWRVPTSTEPYVQRLVEQLETAYKYRELAALCAIQPLVVANRVLVRNAHTLAAIDAATGKRLWEAPTGVSAETSVAEAATRETPQFSWALEQRLWDDATYGTLSSDGRLVFCVEDLAAAHSLNADQGLQLAGARRGHATHLPRSYNRLAAYEIDTGKRAWELGGPKGDDANQQAGAFFLGPPLPVADRLYALAEVNGEIRLIALVTETGAEEWSQQLAVVEDGVMQNRLRRAAGASPSYADGVLVCPTVAGAVVAVDATTRALLWGYQYTEDSVNQRQRMLMGGGRAALAMGGRLGRSGEGQMLDGWLDATAILCDGHVLLAPPEGDDVHCVNLLDGSLLWKAPREDSLYLAGVAEGIVALVGRDHVRGLSLAKGEVVWPKRTIKLPNGSLPSGRGFLSGTQYYLPLNTAEVLVLDLQRGSIAAKARSRAGQTPGNLIPVPGAVLSQTASSLDRFPQLEELERQIGDVLRERPDDPAALAQRGQARLERGDLAGAIDDLRRAYEQQKQSQTRQLLLDSLLEGLGSEFAVYRQHVPFIETLATQPTERGTYLRLLAGGLHAAGEHPAAFEHYLKLSEVPGDQTTLERVDEALKVRRDHWVQAQLAALVQAAPADQAAAMNAAVQQRLDLALKSDRAEPLRDYLRWFGGFGSAQMARQTLAERLAQGDAALELELLLWPALAAANGETAPRDFGRYAELLQHYGRPSEAATAYRRLQENWAERETLPGRTGAQLVETLPADSPVRLALNAADRWPSGKVKKRRARGTRPNSLQRVGLALHGNTSFNFRDLQLEWDQAKPGQPVTAVDSWGRDVWQMQLIDPQQQVGFEYTPGYNESHALGHLLVVSMGRKLWGFDTMGGATGQPPKALWTRDAAESLPGAAASQMLQSQPQTMPWGGERFMVTDGFGQSVAPLGPVTPTYVCLPSARVLTMLDPLSGQVLWTRQGMLPGTECFGDDEVLICVPPNIADSVVLRAIDGQQVGTRRLPPASQRMAAVGRKLLTWSEQGSGIELRLYDPWTGEEVWKRSFATGSRAELLGTDQVAVVQPQGKFLLVDLATGAPAIEADIEADPKLKNIHVLRAPDRVILITNHEWQRENVWLRPVPGPPDNKVVNGAVYGFDAASGAKLWSQPLEQQAILLRQPSDLPLLMFVCHVFERPTGAMPRNTNYVNVLAIDKRSGRELHKERYPAPLGNYTLEADLASHTIQLQLTHESLAFTFTDEPVTEPEASEKPENIELPGDVEDEQ